MGFILSVRAGVPPAMKVSVPAAAPVGPPETGMSAKEPRAEAVTAAEIERDVETGMVLHSMKSFGLGDGQEAGGGGCEDLCDVAA